jgi:hypothetical protein
LSAGSNGVTHSSSGLSADDSTTRSHASANVAGEDVDVHAVATSVLLLSQDFLKQVRRVYVFSALAFSEAMFNLVLWSGFVLLLSNVCVILWMHANGQWFLDCLLPCLEDL